MADSITQTVQQTVAQIAQKGGATVAAGGGVWLWLAENQQAVATLGVIIGAAVAVIGLLINWYYLHKKSKGPPA